MKEHRGILDYELTGRDKSSISWKLTGNLGGEKYRDHTRVPMNEGALFAERQGYHLPGAPTELWKENSVTDVIPGPEAGFYVTEFNLSMPVGYDIPLSVVFNSSAISKPSMPAKIWMAVREICTSILLSPRSRATVTLPSGPQTRYPIPEGILYYSRPNTLAITIWSQEASALELGELELSVDAVVQSGYERPSLVEGERYAERKGGY
ncbi:beta galactosidase jelly roll domain-containing protein [Aspergillus undulatus]|uniref:beta galactosidase jelly roll domain-containing protein n=1 Tax=Aspergillus undulatus TaxID=1810928 RepID=UPI003CCCD7D8